MQPHVSVIIPNLNSHLIDKTLESLLKQTSVNSIAEILVIGLDQPGLVVEQGPIRLISTHVPVTAPVARNIGIQEATGTHFAFIDADCVAKPDWLEMLLLAQQEGHPVVGGSVSLEVNSYRRLCYNLTMFHEFLPSTPAGERKNFGTLNLCVRRDVVEGVGLFDERLARGQDTEWTLRMRRHGFKLHFVPTAIVQHLPEIADLFDVVKLWYRSGSFSIQIRQKYQDLIAMPPFHRQPFLLAALSPLIGAAVTMRLFARNARLLRYAHTIPVVFLTKVAWCLGASQQVRSERRA